MPCPGPGSGVELGPLTSEAKVLPHGYMLPSVEWSVREVKQSDLVQIEARKYK